MLCRALLTATAISYLICVLVLSGMQKEDLDLNLLKKLERHGVNMDDLNNEKIQNECLTKRSLEKNNSKDGYQGTQDRNSSTIELSLTTKNNSDKVKNILNTLDKIDVATVIKYFKGAQETQTAKSETDYTEKVVLINPTHKTHSYATKGSSYTTEKSDKTTSRAFTNSALESTGIEYHEGQPKLESVMKFWEMYMKVTTPKIVTKLVTTVLPKSVTSSMINSDFNPTKQSIQPNERHNQIYDYIDTTVTTTNIVDIDSKEVERLSKILAAYVSKKQTQQTQRPVQKRKEYVAQEIERFLAKNSQNFQNNGQSNAFPIFGDKENKFDKFVINSPSPVNNYFNNNFREKVNEIVNELAKTEENINPISEPDPNIDKNMNLKNPFGSYIIYNNGEEFSKYKNGYNKDLEYIPSNDSNNFHNNFKTNVDDIIHKYIRPDERLNPSRKEYDQNFRNNPYPIFTRRGSPTNYNEQQKEVYYNNWMSTTSEPYYSKLTQDVITQPETARDINSDAAKKLSPDMLKQIAETVKEIVLKDLRKQITSTTTTSTMGVETTLKTTTEATTTVSIKLNAAKIQQRATEAIESFIKLLEQFKPITEEPVVTSNVEITQKTNQVQAYSPVNTMHRPQLNPANPYGVPQQQVKLVPINVNPYGASPFGMNAPKPYQNTVSIMTPMQHLLDIRVDRMSPMPVMIHTHIGPVPPLRIPISQPVPINNNIILTTQLPPSMSKNERDRWNYIIKYNRNPDTQGDIRNVKNRLTEYSNKPIIYEQPENSYQLADIRDRIRNREIMKANGFTERYEREPTRYKIAVEPNMNHIYSDIRGYHERLEGMNKWSTDPLKYEHKVPIQDSKLIKIGSRQILPMNRLKRPQKYNDSHFNDFLKTQRKVNDMLERILATRPKQFGTRSVEIT